MYTGPSSKTHLPISFRQLRTEPIGVVRGPPSATAALRKHGRGAYVQGRAPIHQNLFCSLNWLSNATLYSEQREGAEREQPGLMLPENRTSEDGDGHDSSSDQTSPRSSSVYAKSSYLYGSEKGEETHNTELGGDCGTYFYRQWMQTALTLRAVMDPWSRYQWTQK